MQLFFRQRKLVAMLIGQHIDYCSQMVLRPNVYDVTDSIRARAWPISLPSACRIRIVDVLTFRLSDGLWSSSASMIN